MHLVMGLGIFMRIGVTLVCICMLIKLSSGLERGVNIFCVTVSTIQILIFWSVGLMCLMTTMGILMIIGAMLVYTCMLSKHTLRLEWRVIIFCGMAGVTLMIKQLFSASFSQTILFIVALMFGDLFWLENWSGL